MHPLQKLPVALFLLLALLGAPLHAATYTVTHTGDSGAGSLRQAMLDAQATPADDVIVFAQATDGSPIVLASPLPKLVTATGRLEIRGNGVAATLISGDGQYRIIDTEAQPAIHLTLQRLTLRDAFVAGTAPSDAGGAVRFFGTGASSLTIDAVEFTGNEASFGGAITSYAPAVIRNSTFQGNTGRSFAPVMVIDDTSVHAENLTVSGNDSGGAIIHIQGASGTGRFLHLSVVNNAGQVGVGAYYGANLTLINSLVTSNTATGYELEARAGGSIDTANSVHNVIGGMNGVALTNGVNGNQTGVTSPLVGPLGDYGGPTRTVPLLPGSPALNGGTAAVVDLPATDQRGIARVGAPDVGAFESQGFALSSIGGGGQSAQVSTAFTNPLVVQVTANAPIEPVQDGRVLFNAPSSGASATLGSATATVGSNGRAQTTATANATAGGPYNVTANDAPVGGSSQTFALTNTAAPVYYTIGGSVSGLTGTGLVLRNNGGDDRAVNANGSFTFATSVVQGGSYNVSIHTQPSGQRCTVAQASGSGVAANVNNVAVACTPYFEGTTVPSSGAGGLATATFTGGGNGCRFDLGATGFEAAPTALPPGRTLPQGMLRVKLVGCTAAVAMEVTWPEPVVGYTKHGLAASTDTQPSYFAPAGLAISGRTARFTLTDGAQGDDDWTLNGEIADPAGPMVLAAGPGGPGGAQAIPTLSEWGLLLLSALLGLVALRRRV